MCIFWINPVSDSSLIRAVILEQSGHQFWFNPVDDSGLIRAGTSPLIKQLIPRQCVCH